MASDNAQVKGCLVLNTAIDSPCRDREIVNRVRKQYDYAGSIFKTTLSVAVERGELQTDANPDDLANYLMGILLIYAGLKITLAHWSLSFMVLKVVLIHIMQRGYCPQLKV